VSKEFVLLVRTGKFYWGLILTFMIILIMNYFLPGVLPFGIFEFWFFKFSLAKLAEIPWVLLLIGPGLTILATMLSKRKKDEHLDELAGLPDNIWTSILAGVFEPISFRWLGFYLAIFAFWAIDLLTQELWVTGWWIAITTNLWVAIPLIVLALIGANFIGLIAYGITYDNNTKGCLIKSVAAIVVLSVVIIDLGTFFLVFWSWLKWLYDAILIPLVIIITQGRLSTQLADYGWATMAAAISVNWSFGKAHANRGPIAFLDAWAFGMIEFWVTFNFGLPVAILLHVGYDILIHLIVAWDSFWELITSKEPL
jgi:hypothetical protein